MFEVSLKVLFNFGDGIIEHFLVNYFSVINYSHISKPSPVVG